MKSFKHRLIIYAFQAVTTLGGGGGNGGGPTNQINEALGVPHIEVLQLSEKSSETTIHTCWCFTS